MRRSLVSLATSVLLLAVAAACGTEPEPALPTIPATASSLSVQAPSFTNGTIVRPRYTCDGVNISPAISWTGAPAAAKSIALILNDSDAPGGSYIHWLVYDLPAAIGGFEEAAGKVFEKTAQGGSQGLNSAGDLGYTGPCPPKGEVHAYEINVYALDKLLGLPPLSPRADVIAAIEGSVVAHGAFVTRYQRAERVDENVVFKLTPTP